MRVQSFHDARPMRGGWSPGNYYCACSTCGKRFGGDKSAVQCANCAYMNDGGVDEALILLNLEADRIAKVDANRKESNPKDAFGVRKVGLSCVSTPVLWELAAAMAEGAAKYGRHNYRAVGVRASVYYDAAMTRHLGAWWEGQDDDPDSGINHITKAIASLVVLRDSMIRGNWVDDRPPKSDPDILDEMNSRIEALAIKYQNPKPPFTEKQLDSTGG
jgi:dATP/dGTP diphosphohydrolase